MRNARAYQSWLMRPLTPEDPSVKTLSLPELWERARCFYNRVVKETGGAGRLRLQGLFNSEDRRVLKGWLQPVERLVRLLLVAHAVLLLVMAPEEFRRLRETRRAPPAKAKPEGGEDLADAPAPERKEQRAGFRILKHSFGDEPATRPAEERPGPQPHAQPYDEAETVEDSGAQLHPFALRQMLRPPSRAALALARRIEALARVIDRPEPAIRRLARILARLPRGVIDPLAFGLAFTGGWFHCGSEYRRAHTHSERLFGVFNTIAEPG